MHSSECGVYSKSTLDEEAVAGSGVESSPSLPDLSRDSVRGKRGTAAEGRPLVRVSTRPAFCVSGEPAKRKTASEPVPRLSGLNPMRLAQVGLGSGVGLAGLHFHSST